MLRDMDHVISVTEAEEIQVHFSRFTHHLGTLLYIPVKSVTGTYAKAVSKKKTRAIAQDTWGQTTRKQR